jgi:pimeloyl-ACP methyl ester carboxylesterase
MWSADPNAPIDCFYVYPTVSTDTGVNSDMNPDEAELRVVEQQFARFGSVCRTYAPSYRQVTVAGLMARLGSTEDRGLDQGLGYDDVRDAFRYYLENDNQGRGFVLIGHSQGSYVLTALIAQEIDGRPVQDRLVSALLVGAAPTVARGQDVGGSFRTIPLCRSAGQTGCLIAFSTFRSTAPPPENSLFGVAPDPSLSVVCTNPAALGGGSGELHAYLSGDGTTIVGARPSAPWVAGGPAVETPFVSAPGLLTATCATNEHATFLEVTVHGNPSDPRVDNIGGDITPQWGLHLIDVNLGIGNLVDIVGQQAAAWRGGR